MEEVSQLRRLERDRVGVSATCSMPETTTQCVRLFSHTISGSNV